MNALWPGSVHRFRTEAPMLKRVNGAMEMIVRRGCSHSIVVAAVIVFLGLHEKGTETLLRFPDDPPSYRNLADAFWTVG